MEEHRAKIKARKDAWLERHPDQKAIHMATLADPEAYKKRVEESRAKRKQKNLETFDPVLRAKYLAHKKAKLELKIEKLEDECLLLEGIITSRKLFLTIANI